MKIVAVHRQTASCLLTFSDGTCLELDFFWLRDHANDDGSYDARSHQRETDTANLDPLIVPDLMTLIAEGTALEITWPDCTGTSRYEASLLLGLRAVMTPVASPLHADLAEGWDAHSDFSGTRVTWQQWCDDGGRSLLDSLRKFGFAVLSNCPLDAQASSVRQVAQQFGYVRETLFGGVWHFSANEAMADSAYTPRLLRPHTDGTYSHDAPGLQLLLCQHLDATGGESILVDGWRIFKQIIDTEPQHAAVLKRVPVPGQYLGDGTHLRAERPVFRCDTNGRLCQVSYNNYDRAPFLLPQQEMRAFYAGLRAFESQASDPGLQWQSRLAPGDMLVFDNWRLLHGRHAYRGERHMSGCYVNREDYESRLRMVGQV